MTRPTLIASIEHKTKNTYVVQYEIPSTGLCGAAIVRGADLEAAKEKFPKHYEARKYQVQWRGAES